MEKKITGMVGGIQKFSVEDGPGIRTTVFLKGCPLNCVWCHNPELIRFERQLMHSTRKCVGDGACMQVCPQKAISPAEGGGLAVDRDKCTGCLACTEVCYAEALTAAGQEMTAEEVLAEVLQDKGYYDQTGGGMTLSGGEILSQHEFAKALMDGAMAKGVQVVLDTSGFGPYEAFFAMAQNCQYILYDMKCIDDAAHRELTGVSNGLILENLAKLAADPDIRPKLWMRMPLIAGLNDTDAIIDATCAFYEKHGLKKVTLLPYHELGVQKSRNLGKEQAGYSAPDTDRLHAIRDRFAAIGMEVEILGESK